MPTPSKMRLGDRVNRTLAGLLLLGNASAVDTTRDTISNGSGGHGTHGERGKAPTDFQPLALEWAEFFHRAVELAEADLAMERGEIPRPIEARKGRVAAARAQQRDRRIAREAIYRGRRPEFVAHLEGCSVTLVRDVRLAAKLDALTGHPFGRALTASRPSN